MYKYVGMCGVCLGGGRCVRVCAVWCKVCVWLQLNVCMYLWVLALVVVVYAKTRTFILLLDETHGEKAKGSLRERIKQYLDRAEQLKKFIRKGHKGKKVVEGGGGKSKSHSSHSSKASS